jgi:hypothetical protein
MFVPVIRKYTAGYGISYKMVRRRRNISSLWFCSYFDRTFKRRSIKDDVDIYGSSPHCPYDGK